MKMLGRALRLPIERWDIVVILGIDTSNYTTSVALMSEQGQLLADRRIILTVEQGERGLRQSQALFQHQKNLPKLLTEILPLCRGQIDKIAVSVRPRPKEDSYMPVFLAGESFGRVLSAAYGVPFVPVSHQEGHIAAGLWSAAKGPVEKEFLAVHLSGGTTDLLRINCHAGAMEIETLGSSLDLHAGQFVDRVGVALGLPFPAGPHLEKIASNGVEGAVTLSVRTRGYDISFSGPESEAMRLLAKGVSHADLALAVFCAVAKALEKVCRRAIAETGLAHILFVGGVAANRQVRERLTNRLKPVGAHLYFAAPSFSADNAVGVCYLGLKKDMPGV